jgi:hypothetical protein
MMTKRRYKTTVLVACALTLWAEQSLADAGPDSHDFEAGVVAGVQHDPILGLYLGGPKFWGLRPGFEYGIRSQDKIEEDGQVEERQVQHYIASIAGRYHVTQEFFWGTKFAVGANEVVGRYAADADRRIRRPVLFFTQFDASLGLATPWNAADDNGTVVFAEAGFSMRQNSRPTRAMILEDGERLRASTPGTFVRIGFGF